MRRLVTGIIIVVGLVLLQNGCRSVSKCESEACLQQQYQSNPSKTLAYWQPLIQKPIQQRLGPVPDELLQLVTVDNQLGGYKNRPIKYDNPEAYRLLHLAYESLPLKLKQLVSDKLAGVYLVRNLGSSGYTESIHDEQGDPVAGVIVLDAVLFELLPDIWASWRDSTPFSKDIRYQIRTTINDQNNPDPLAAIRFLLIHELAHVYSIGSDIHPFWGDDRAKVDLTQYPYSALSWSISRPDNQYVSLFDNRFPTREQLVFYLEPALQADQMAATLDALRQTNIPSLYGATRPEEDFAEMFAIYVNSEIFGNPYKVEVLRDGEPLSEMTACFPERCPKKFEFMRQLLRD